MKPPDHPQFHRIHDEQRHSIMDQITTALRKDGSVSFAFLYGSFLAGATFRDIDVGVFVVGKSASTFFDLEIELSQRIEKVLSCGFPVEVKVLNEAPEPFRFSVIKCKLLFAKNEDVLVDFMTSTARKYLDFAPLRYHYIKEAMAS